MLSLTQQTTLLFGYPFKFIICSPTCWFMCAPCVHWFARGVIVSLSLVFSLMWSFIGLHSPSLMFHSCAVRWYSIMCSITVDEMFTSLPTCFQSLFTNVITNVQSCFMHRFLYDLFISLSRFTDALICSQIITYFRVNNRTTLTSVHSTASVHNERHTVTNEWQNKWNPWVNMNESMNTNYNIFVSVIQHIGMNAHKNKVENAWMHVEHLLHTGRAHMQNVL